MADTEKLIEEIESERAAVVVKESAKNEALLEDLQTGYEHAERRIVKYGKWKEVKNELESKGIDYKTDEFLNPPLSDEEIIFFRHMFDDELMQASGIWPGWIYGPFNNDTFIHNYCMEYRRVLKKGNRYSEVLAAQKNAGGNYRSVTSRIILVIFYAGLIGWIISLAVGWYSSRS